MSRVCQDPPYKAVEIEGIILRFNKKISYYQWQLILIHMPRLKTVCMFIAKKILLLYPVSLSKDPVKMSFNWNQMMNNLFLSLFSAFIFYTPLIASIKA